MRTDWKAVIMNIVAYALIAGALLVTFFFTNPLESASASDIAYSDLQSAPTPTSTVQKNVNATHETTPVPSNTPITMPQTTVAEAPQSVININTASEAVIDTLPGIGPVKAAAIVAWRTENGPFQKLEDLMDVKGIGEKTFAKLKPLICH